MSKILKKLETKSKEELLEIAAAVDALEKKKRTRKVDFYLPDTGPYRRELYPKHVAFLNRTADCRESIFIAGNRTGKTMAGSAFITFITTGEYPHWYKGRKWTRPVSVWVVGKDGKTVRDILQKELLGPKGAFGSGMIPKARIKRVTTKPGVPDAIESIYVESVYGGDSVIQFKSYDQGFDAFVGTHMDAVWFDEEVPEDIYSECLMRTSRVNKFDPESEGQIIFTFTPDHGITPLVETFFQDGTSSLNEGSHNGRFLVNVGWDDVPHLSQDEKERMLAKLLPHMREAKIKGIPAVGSGAIYPIPDEDIIIDPIQLPDYFEFAYGMDTSWQGKAVIWGAYDSESDIWYIYDEFQGSEMTTGAMASIINQKRYGGWIEGVIDPAATKQYNEDAGRNLFESYRRLGLRLHLANNSFEYGIFEVLNRMQSGKIKFFSNCQKLIQQKHFYRRDEKGRIVNPHAYHLLDALRYLVVSGHQASQAPLQLMKQRFTDRIPNYNDGRDEITGY